jgi:hypothetical protein
MEVTGLKSQTLIVALALIIVCTILAIIIDLMDLFTKTTTDEQFSGFDSTSLAAVYSLPYSFDSLWKRRKMGLVHLWSFLFFFRQLSYEQNN